MNSPPLEKEVSEVLQKALDHASLNRIPRNPRHRDVILALVCLDMQRRYPYTEIEFNDYLKRELSAFNASVDHVTCRRYAVDCGFVKRDRGGNRYFLNFPKIEATLGVDMTDAKPGLISIALEASRRRSNKHRKPAVDPGR